MCQTKRQAHEALALVERVLRDHLGLQLSAEKTKVTTFGKGYEFLGFFLSSRSRRMREKSVQKFKAKVRELTVRKCNLDAEAVKKLNRVIRGTANYFATQFSTCRWMFQKLDSWIRMRLRCMKLKRKNYNDNHKLRVGFFRRTPWRSAPPTGSRRTGVRTRAILATASATPIQVTDARRI